MLHSEESSRAWGEGRAAGAQDQEAISAAWVAVRGQHWDGASRSMGSEGPAEVHQAVKGEKSISHCMTHTSKHPNATVRIKVAQQ